jgi:predicted Zn-dependent peptidase
MTRSRLLFLLALVLTAVGLVGHAQAPAAMPKLEFEKFTLPNGLQVILHVDRKLPIVHVNEWFHVGSKNEKPGRTGFAHLFEHMMFQGSKNAKEDYFVYVEKAGANIREGGVNGTTNNDRTNYFATVPSGNLENLLWVESDRIATLADATDQKKLDNQRDVVKNERRQRIENRPMGLVSKVQLEALYPPQHPYYHEVIGSMDDLSAASVDDVKSFFRTYYAPSNATLTIAGDFDRARLKELVEKYFGPLPAAPAPRRAGGAPARLDAAKRIAMEAKIQQPQIFISYLTPSSLSPGDHELDLLGAVLANGKSSRLYRRLVYEMKIAQSVSAAQESQKLSSNFEISASPMPGHTLDEILAVVDEEVEKLRAQPVEARELERAKNQIESDTIRSLEPLLARAERLQSYNYLIGDPGYVGEDLRQYRSIDAGALQRTAAQYLRSDARVIVTVDPSADAPIMGRVKP